MSTRKKTPKTPAAPRCPTGYAAETWLMPPMTKKELAVRLRVRFEKTSTAYRAVDQILRPHGLRRYFGERQLWEVRLDSMSATMREALTR